MNVTEQELLMYRVMGMLAENGAPMVFKGGLITKAVLEEHGLERIARPTKDIDIDWVGRDKSIDTIVSIINDTVQDINPLFYATIDREPSETSSGRIAILDNNRDTVFRMDIDLRHPPTEIVQIQIGGATINCVDAREIIADKISTISSPQIFRRSKDLIDVYALSSCVGFMVSDIKTIIHESGHELKNFASFKERSEDLRHAYEKLMGIDEKPEFDAVYERLCEIIEPFEEHSAKDYEWDPITMDYSELEAQDKVENAEEVIEYEDIDDWDDDDSDFGSID